MKILLKSKNNFVLLTFYKLSKQNHNYLKVQYKNELYNSHYICIDKLLLYV